MPQLLSIRLEFILFALTLLGVAVFHKITTWVAAIGFAAIVLVKYLFIPHFSMAAHLFGGAHGEGEWSVLLNLTGLILGFGILARHFEDSKVPEIIPRFLPADWKGGFILLIFIFVLSSFLDNIAAAMIGGAIAHVVFKGKIHIGYLAAIIAASNAGGSGSVVGDTTTTLMWIDGVNPKDVLHAYVAAIGALAIFGIFASAQQHKLQAITDEAHGKHAVDWKKISVVILVLLFAIATNYWLDMPAAGVWIAILIGALITPTPWNEVRKSISGTLFLLALVAAASLMPVEDLPRASWHSTLALGFVSAVFDNIPLTKLCLTQGGYDWGVLAYAVGFGGSMLWFGSSAGVALSNQYPEIRNTGTYLRKSWHVIVAYIAGFALLMLVLGWNPHKPHKQIKKDKDTYNEYREPEHAE